MMLVWTTYLWRWGWHLIRPTMMTRTMMRWHLLVFLLISWLVFLLISWFSVYGAAVQLSLSLAYLFFCLGKQTCPLELYCPVLAVVQCMHEWTFFGSLWSSACLNYAFIFSLVKCHQSFFMHMRCWKKIWGTTYICQWCLWCWMDYRSRLSSLLSVSPPCAQTKCQFGLQQGEGI